MEKGYYETCGIPKGEPRKRTKARRKRVHADRVAEIRAYVFARERNICRCCRARAAESMHELRPKSLRGKVSKTNSVAVCGDGVQGCHGFLQRHEIVCYLTMPVAGAEDLLLFQPRATAASEWMKLRAGQMLQSAPMRDMEAMC